MTRPRLFDHITAKGNTMSNQNPADGLTEIERLRALNNQLSQQLIRNADTLQESARQIAADAWERGYQDRVQDQLHGRPNTDRTPNPYRGESL